MRLISREINLLFDSTFLEIMIANDFDILKGR